MRILPAWFSRPLGDNLPRMSNASSSTPRDTLSGLRVAFAGKFAGLTKREAQQLVRTHGAVTVEDLTVPTW